MIEGNDILFIIMITLIADKPSKSGPIFNKHKFSVVRKS